MSNYRLLFALLAVAFCLGGGCASLTLAKKAELLDITSSVKFTDNAYTIAPVSYSALDSVIRRIEYARFSRVKVCIGYGGFGADGSRAAKDALLAGHQLTKAMVARGLICKKLEQECRFEGTDKKPAVNMGFVTSVKVELR